ncbi:MAG: tetratricopeptide repeat protein [Acidobacteria bacterium]|nr:tetratricopeptide repeat protein [Acidobacteriota bacterium]
MLAFRTDAFRAQAERRAPIAGVVFFCAGYIAYALVRNSVYAILPEVRLQQTGLMGAVFDLQLLHILLFLLLIYIPAVIVMSNAISGDGLGFSVSRQEYQTHVSALMPLWGLLFFICAPLQWLIPHFLIVGLFEISIGMLVRSILILIYTFWAIKMLNYLAPVQALGVFALSCFTLPIYYILTSFFFALPFFIMIPLIYLGYQWIRGYQTAHSSGRAYQQHLHTLTANPQDADAPYQLGLIHLERRSLDAARRYFESAIKIDPKIPDYSYSLGRVYELKGDWARALEQYEETYRLDPEYGLGDIFREVGKAYLHTGNENKAIEFLEFFLNKRGSDPEGRYWLAVALQKRGDIEQMRVQLNRIIEQARSHPRFFRKENREWIYRARNMIRNSRFEIRN